ncbi:MAG TPA: DUF3788 family protein [Desulfitobacteriaceae bacterium]|nr:DUF3788 family protein [Desulfitobacteriaceae bacterium]
MSKNESVNKQLLRDPNIQPTNDVIAAALGEQYAAYTQFLAMLAGFDVTPQWRYYNDGKAWLAKGLYKWKSLRGTDKEKTIFWLSIWYGFFRISFFFAEKAQLGLQGLAVGENTKKMIEDAKPMAKLKFFPLVFDVHSDDLFDDLCALIDYQKSIK